MSIGKFVIYGIPRVGSNFFISQLNLHPDIICHYEVFHRKGVYYGFEDKRIVGNFPGIQERDEDTDAFLDFLWTENSDCSMVGYNLFPDQNKNVFEQSVLDTSQKNIIIKRKGILNNFISMKIAEKTGAWSSKGEKNPKKLTTANKAISFNPKEFQRYVRKVNEYYNNLETNIALNGQNYTVIYYEEFIEQKQVTIDKVFGFLGVKPFELPDAIKFSKQNKEGLHELVSNYDELSQYLANGYHHFL